MGKGNYRYISKENVDLQLIGEAKAKKKKWQFVTLRVFGALVAMDTHAPRHSLDYSRFQKNF
jgi:hypothetical protein